MKKKSVHTLILGSGAAGLAAAVRLHAEGISDLCILTEGLSQGTSINTGSDKQTYYKLGMYGDSPDSPREMASSYLAGGAAHGDLALIEAVLSPRAFFHLVNLGVPFPHDVLGQYIGYKTDHDPRRRATSCGPYTSKEMCRALIREVRHRNITVWEDRVAIKLLTLKENNQQRVGGLIAFDTKSGEVEVWQAENIIFAVGGPGGLYDASVYPAVHTGAIGLAFEVGATGVSLPESQFGLASFTDLTNRNLINHDQIKNVESHSLAQANPAPVSLFRWNVSGTFMQVLPRFISTGSDGISDEKEFLQPWFESMGAMNSRVFLKGYQWPFDVRKIQGSSLIDLIVYHETCVRGRRVFLDFRSNPEGLDFDSLDQEAFSYLEKSGALFGLPIDRLEKMNPGAIALYLDHGIDLRKEPLEIAVCAQHNNGGLAGNIWYESVNLRHFFPIGEVNGSHGVARPGGSALNAGQVGAFRAAELIAHHYQSRTLDERAFDDLAEKTLIALDCYLSELRRFPFDWQAERHLLQKRMSREAGHFRSLSGVQAAVVAAWEQFDRLRSPRSNEKNSSGDTTSQQHTDWNPVESLRTLQLCLAHAVYLEAILFQLETGVGSRGSAAVIGPEGNLIHPNFPENWRTVPESPEFRERVLQSGGEFPFFSIYQKEESATVPDITNNSFRGRYCWENVRPLPITDDWFENVWKDFREKIIFAT